MDPLCYANFKDYEARMGRPKVILMLRQATSDRRWPWWIRLSLTRIHQMCRLCFLALTSQTTAVPLGCLYLSNVILQDIPYHSCSSKPSLTSFTLLSELSLFIQPRLPAFKSFRRHGEETRWKYLPWTKATSQKSKHQEFLLGFVAHGNPSHDPGGNLASKTSRLGFLRRCL